MRLGERYTEFNDLLSYVYD